MDDNYCVYNENDESKINNVDNLRYDNVAYNIDMIIKASIMVVAKTSTTKQYNKSVTQQWNNDNNYAETYNKTSLFIHIIINLYSRNGNDKAFSRQIRKLRNYFQGKLGNKQVTGKKYFFRKEYIDIRFLHHNYLLQSFLFCDLRLCLLLMFLSLSYKICYQLSL